MFCYKKLTPRKYQNTINTQKITELPNCFVLRLKKEKDLMLSDSFDSSQLIRHDDYEKTKFMRSHKMLLIVRKELKNRQQKREGKEIDAVSGDFIVFQQDII